MEKLSIKQALFDLLSVAEQLPRILYNSPKYKDLIKVLTEKDYYNEYDLPSPTIKQLQERLGLKPHVIRKQIKDIYTIVFTYDEAVLQFHQVEYHFTFSYMGKYFGFLLNELPVVPHIGENFRVPFAKAAVGFDSFFVDNITYTLEGRKQIIEFILHAGYSNEYLKLRKDKAKILGELTRKEIWEMDNYDMERKIRQGDLSP